MLSDFDRDTIFFFGGGGKKGGDYAFYENAT